MSEARRRYRTPMTPVWFMSRPGYRRFMAREATAIAIALYLVYLLVLLLRIGQGPAAYMSFIDMARHPVPVIAHSLIFGAVVYHSITWFNLTPKIMPLYVAEEKVSDLWAAIIMGYAPFFAVSVLILWGILS